MLSGALADRIFWLYFIIILIFIIIGGHTILCSRGQHAGVFLVIWILMNIALLIAVYCAVHVKRYNQAGCATINVIFITLLLLSTLFVDRLQYLNKTSAIAGIFTILGALILIKLVIANRVSYIAGIVYIVLALTLLLWSLCIG